jgi:hypothetical protein
MAVTSNTYTSNGSTLQWDFTFDVLSTADVKVSLNGTDTNAFSVVDSKIILNSAASAGTVIKIYRDTNDTALVAEFFSGSAIRAQDLNENFQQALYIAQEVNNAVADSTIATTTALSQSTLALANSSTAVSTSNAASASISSAVTSANNAVVSATTANTTANAAVVTANAAASAIASSLIYSNVNNVASIPLTPSNNTAVQVVDSTGIQSFTPLTGLPVGFVGSSGLWVRLRYNSPTSSWVYVEYNANNPDGRYLGQSGGTLTGNLNVPSLNGGPLAGNRNVIINGNPLINQRNYVSGTATVTANQYTLDRWRVVVAGQSITWTTTDNIRTVTAPASGVEQVVEGHNLFTGNYTLSWTGTALAAINGVLVPNGGNVSLIGGTNVTVKFFLGTFSKVQLEPGTRATPFEQLSYSQTYQSCLRYFYRPHVLETLYAYASAAGQSTSRAFFFPVAMRVAPLLSVLTSEQINSTGSSISNRANVGVSVFFQSVTAGPFSLAVDWTYFDAEF